MINKSQIMIAILLVAAISMVAGCAGSTGTGTTEKTAKIGDNVSVDYAIWLENGTIVETSNITLAKQSNIYEDYNPYTPVSFIVGSGTEIKGFEDAVIGMKINESKNFTLTPDQAYGAYNASMIEPLPLGQLLSYNITPHVNDTLYYNNYAVKVIQIVPNATDPNNSAVYIDFNPPMAGKTLRFAITVRDIREVNASLTP